MDKVCVRIDEAGHNDSAGKIEFAGATGFRKALDAGARADCCDAAITNEDGAVRDESGIGESAPAARRGAAKGKELGTVGEKQGILRAGIGHVRFGFHGTEI